MMINFLQFFRITLPLSIIIGAGLVTMLLGLILKEKGHGILLILSLLGIGGAMGASLWLWKWRLFALNSLMVLDPFAYFFDLILLLIAFFTCLNHYEYLKKQETDYPEIFPLTLFSLSGM